VITYEVGGNTSVPFILSPSKAASSHRQPTPHNTQCDSCRSQGRPKINILGTYLTLRYVNRKPMFNPLNAELNFICYLLILLGDLTFMGPCIVSIFQYISNKMKSYTVYLYLETALHVSGGNSTHHQERIQLHLQHLVFVTPLLLFAAIVEELEPA
jgi:hypothetical protein